MILNFNISFGLISGNLSLIKFLQDFQTDFCVFHRAQDFYGSATNHLEVGIWVSPQPPPHPIASASCFDTNFKTSKQSFVRAQADHRTTVQSQLVYSTCVHTTECTTQSEIKQENWHQRQHCRGELRKFEHKQIH